MTTRESLKQALTARLGAYEHSAIAHRLTVSKGIEGTHYMLDGEIILTISPF